MLVVLTTFFLGSYDPDSVNTTIQFYNEAGQAIYVMIEADFVNRVGTYGPSHDSCYLEDSSMGYEPDFRQFWHQVANEAECRFVAETIFETTFDTSTSPHLLQYAPRGCVLSYVGPGPGYEAEYRVSFNNAPGEFQPTSTYFNDYSTFHVRTICAHQMYDAPEHNSGFTTSPTKAPSVSPTKAPTTDPTPSPTASPSPLTLEEYHGELCTRSGCDESADHRVLTDDGTNICFFQTQEEWDGRYLQRYEFITDLTCPVCDITSSEPSSENRSLSDQSHGFFQPIQKTKVLCEDFPCHLLGADSCEELFCSYNSQTLMCEPVDTNTGQWVHIELSDELIVEATASAVHSDGHTQTLMLKREYNYNNFPLTHVYFRDTHVLKEEIEWSVDITHMSKVDISNPTVLCYSLFVRRKDAGLHRIAYRPLCYQDGTHFNENYIDLVPVCNNLYRYNDCASYGCEDPYPGENMLTFESSTPCLQGTPTSFQAANRILQLRLSPTRTFPVLSPNVNIYTHSPVTSEPTLSPMDTFAPTVSPTEFEPVAAHDCSTNPITNIITSWGDIEKHSQYDGCFTNQRFYDRDNVLSDCAKQPLTSNPRVENYHSCLTCTVDGESYNCPRKDCSIYRYNMTECVLNWCYPTGDDRYWESWRNSEIGCIEPTTNIFTILDIAHGKNISFVKSIKLHKQQNEAIDIYNDNAIATAIKSDTIVDGNGLALHRKYTDTLTVTYNNVRLHNAYSSPIRSFNDACRAITIVDLDGIQHNAVCDDSVAVIRDLDVDILFRPQRQSAGNFFTVRFHLDTLPPTGTPTRTPSQTPTPSPTDAPVIGTKPPTQSPTTPSPTDAPTTFISSFCQPTGDATCPSSLTGIISGSGEVADAMRHVNAPVLRDGGSFRYCVSTPGTQNGGGDLACTQCELSKVSGHYVTNCDNLNCNVLTQTSCELSPVCTFTTQCEYIAAPNCEPVRLNFQPDATWPMEIVGLISASREDLNIAISSKSQNMICKHQIKFITELLVINVTSQVVISTPPEEFTSGFAFESFFSDVDTSVISPTAPAPAILPTPPPPTAACDDINDPVLCVETVSCNWFGQLDQCHDTEYQVPFKKEQIELRDELSDLYLTLFIITVAISGLFSILHAYDCWRFCFKRKGTSSDFSIPAPPQYKKTPSTKSLL